MLAINAVMFAVEIVAGLLARSASMQVDARDFFGDAANMRSVWICSRNDAIGNLAVSAAALGVFGRTRAGPTPLWRQLWARSHSAAHGK